MKLLSRFIRHFARLLAWRGNDGSGVASIEFVFVAPVMILMVFGTAETVRFVRTKSLFQSAVSGLAEGIAAQSLVSSGPGGGTLQDFCKGAQLNMTPLSPTSLSAVLASVSNPVGKGAQEDWEVDTACPTVAQTLGATAVVALGSPLVPSSGDSVLIVRAQYVYNPMIKTVIPLALNLSTTLLVRPRSGTIVCMKSATLSC